MRSREQYAPGKRPSMQQHHSQFYGGDGIVVKGVENTIRNVGTLASEGMRETDRTIIRLMTSGMC